METFKVSIFCSDDVDRTQYGRSRNNKREYQGIMSYAERRRSNEMIDVDEIMDNITS